MTQRVRRRRFIQAALGTVPLMMLDPWTLLFAQQSPGAVGVNRLGHLANRGTNIEGTWTLRNVEGVIPNRLEGSLFRVGPGQRENQGQILQHFFDGDPYLSKFVFSNQSVSLTSKFIETPQRLDELRSGRMLYNEFGTKAPTSAKGDKNQPNINILPFEDSLLLLSESSHPTRVGIKDLDYRGLSNFKASLPKDVTFTAHPKVDPKTGDIYAFGQKQGLGLDFKVYKIEKATGKAREIFSMKQNQAHIVHDMVMTENFLVFVIPPVFLRLSDLISGRRPLAAAILYDQSAMTKVIVVPKVRGRKVHTFNIPSVMVFHHGNAFEDNGRIVFHSFTTKDFSVMELLADWRSARKIGQAALTEFDIDLESNTIRTKTLRESFGDFPAWNQKQNGQFYQFLYFLELGSNDDPFAFRKLIKYDVATKKIAEVESLPSVAIGEPIFVPDPLGQEEDDGWILHLGYSADRDESFLQILSAKTLESVARIWTGHFLPLGFHGCFIPNTKKFRGFPF